MDVKGSKVSDAIEFSSLWLRPSGSLSRVLTISSFTMITAFLSFFNSFSRLLEYWHRLVYHPCIVSTVCSMVYEVTIITWFPAYIHDITFFSKSWRALLMSLESPRSWCHGTSNSAPMSPPAVLSQWQKIAEPFTSLRHAHRTKGMHLVKILHSFLISTLPEPATTRWEPLHQDYPRLSGRAYFFFNQKPGSSLSM